MGKKLTEGQKAARRAVREAARRVIAEMDGTDWRKECVEFVAHFHLDCTRFDRAKFYGEPAPMTWPVYQYVKTKAIHQ